MLKLFSRKVAVIEPELKEWIFDSFKWALENFDASIFYDDTLLVLPNDSFFPDRVQDKREMVEKIFERIKKYSGMEDWKTRLVAQKPGANAVVAPTVAMQNVPQGSAGTFSMSSRRGNAKITYDPKHVGEPEKLIATLAHELAHYLSLDAKSPPPGGDEYWEYATDLMSIYMGFGIFSCNSAFTFKQYTNFDSQGWQTESLGYLSQEGMLYCLAIFCVLKNISRKEPLKFLSGGGLKSYFKIAFRDVEQETELINELKIIR